MTLLRLRDRARLRPGHAGIAATIGAACLLAGSAAAEPSPPGRTGVLLFISSPGGFVLPLGATEARRSTSRTIEEAWTRDGYDVLGVEELEPLLRKWAVRSERDLRTDFLAALSADMGIDRLLVIRVILHADRTIFLGRALDPDGGGLVWLDAAEFPNDRTRWAEEADARRQLRDLAVAAGRELAARWGDRRPVVPTGTMVLMPLDPVGLGLAVSEIATHCLLRALLDSALWTVPDPALVIGALRETRHDLDLIDPESRRALGERFAADALLIPRLISFSSGRVAFTPYADDDSEGPALNEMADTPLFLSLSLVDCGSGEVVAGEGRYLKAEDRIGIFGTVKDVRLVDRLQTGVDVVFRDLFPSPRGQ